MPVRPDIHSCRHDASSYRCRDRLSEQSLELTELRAGYVSALRYHRAMTPGLVMVDLDGTLVDRDSAFRISVERLCTEFALDDAVERIMSIDDGGYAPRGVVAETLCREFPSLNTERCWQLLDEGGGEDVVLDGRIVDALERCRTYGNQVVIVSNGPTEMQERKIYRTGLDRLVEGWVVSGTEGVAKPDAGIFRIAAARVDSKLAGAWMIGDNADADIHGAHVLGCRTSWISRGRAWPHRDFEPTRVDTDVAHALLTTI
jgi:putative hydrolase of the HAD superfamily